MAESQSASLLGGRSETQRNGKAFQQLYSDSMVQRVTTGTGATLTASAIDLILEQLPSELIFVTCFWTRSESLDSIVKLLSALSERAVHAGKIIRVRICVSSLSIMQKVFHTWSSRGRIYKPSEWRSKLYLPFDLDALPHIDLAIKSVFIPPFSVMHAKYIIVDRNVCILPSCNVSWEDWFECSVQLRGPIVNELYNYWESFWGGRRDSAFSLAHVASVRPASGESHLHTDGAAPGTSDIRMDTLSHTQESRLNESTSTSPSSTSTFPATTTLALKDPIPTLLLPSSHHQNPRFRPFPWQAPAKPPSTPLNDFQMHLFATATRSIYIRTPNLTCKPVITALLNATRRGVNVHVLTNRNLMTLEQIVTAGTTTPRCVAAMQKRHASFKHHQSPYPHGRYTDDVNLESGLPLPEPALGDLKIEYYDDLARGTSLPVKAHIKLMVVDEKIVVSGSGNQDRASWYTSQEVGVAFEDENVAGRIMQLAGRTPAQMFGMG